MRGLSASEETAIERAAAEPMLDQATVWAAVNSGTRNLGGLEPAKHQSFEQMLGVVDRQIFA